MPQQSLCKPLVGTTGEPLPLGGAERDALIKAFLAGGGARYANDPDAWFLLDALVEFGCDSCQDPLRWSPDTAELFLMYWVRRHITGSGTVLARAPEVLAAWVPWAADLAGLPAHAANETLDLISDLASTPLEILDDQESWRPHELFASVLC